MKKLFKDIRHGDIDAVRAAIAKKPAVVNEVYDGKAPKKDVGQSPLQVAIKVGEFEIIELLLENGADPDFREDPALVPPRSLCMSVLNDAIIGAMDSILYGNYESSRKYVGLVEELLKKGADPNKEAIPVPDTNQYRRVPTDTLVYHASENLSRYAKNYYSGCAEAFGISKKALFDILDLLKRYGADFDRWLDGEWGGTTNRAAFLDDFVPAADRTYEYQYRGKTFQGVVRGDVDKNQEIRAALKEYFKTGEAAEVSVHA